MTVPVGPAPERAREHNDSLLSKGLDLSPALRRTWMSPSVRALLMQCLAFPLMLGAVFGLARCGAAISFLHVALIQGAIAAALGWGCLASWWRPIQFLFPLALLGASRLALPPAWFLAGFVVLLLVFWSTFRTQVPYYPSGRAVPTAVASLLPGRPVRVIDIGSGLGGLVLELARARPESRFEGIELAPLPWFASRLRAALGRSRARFIRGDYEDLDFGHYDLVFAYLSPAAMDALWRKARREMRPGSLLVSYEFVVDGCRPDRIVAPTDGGPTLNIWHL